MYVFSISTNVYLIQRIRRRIVSAKLCFFSTFVNNLKYNDPEKERGVEGMKNEINLG